MQFKLTQMLQMQQKIVQRHARHCPVPVGLAVSFTSLKVLAIPSNSALLIPRPARRSSQAGTVPEDGPKYYQEDVRVILMLLSKGKGKQALGFRCILAKLKLKGLNLEKAILPIAARSRIQAD